MQLENSHDGVKQWASIDRRRFLALVGTGVASSGLGIPVLASAGEQARAMGTAPNGTPRLGLEMEYLFSRRTQVRREIIGPVPEGFRVNIYTEKGEVRGPKLAGTTGVGGDWFTVRRDGMGIVDSRVMIHAESGALIYSHYTGMTDFGPDAYERIVRGALPTPKKIFIAVRFQTAHPDYTWMNRVQAIGVGMNEGDSNLWDTYALR